VQIETIQLFGAFSFFGQGLETMTSATKKPLYMLMFWYSLRAHYGSRVIHDVDPKMMTINGFVTWYEEIAHVSFALKHHFSMHNKVCRFMGNPKNRYYCGATSSNRSSKR
jgi:hypothetical protein